MKATGKSLKELSEGLFIYPQLLKNVTVKDKNACLESKELQEVVDSVANDLGNEGRILVRPSGTEPFDSCHGGSEKQMSYVLNMLSVLQIS